MMSMSSLFFILKYRELGPLSMSQLTLMLQLFLMQSRETTILTKLLGIKDTFFNHMRYL